MENVKESFESVADFEDDPFIIVIDDVATTGGTLKYSGKALLEAGAEKVVGLAMGRAEQLDALEEAEIYTPEGNND